MSDANVDRATRLDTATLSDALDKCGLNGQCYRIKPRSTAFRMAGRAWTLRYGPAGDPPGTVGDYIDDLPAGTVVVLDNQGRDDATVWGDILTEVAHRKGIAGTLIDGVNRDVSLALELGYPIYSRDNWMRTGKDRVQVEATGVPVNIGGVRVCPGDLVRGDAEVDTTSMSDPVLIRADGAFLYTLPSVVDDIDMGITHVIRGEDHVANTGTQIEIFQALGAREPVFAHMPLLVDHEGKGLSIGIVRARFNHEITSAMADACVSELSRLGVAADDMRIVDVPGALEVPIALQALADSGTHDALIALGCVIRGETYHFELVANESGAGVSRIALDHRIPVANAILTVETEAQALARVEDKSRDAARVAVEMSRLLDWIDTLDTDR